MCLPFTQTLSIISPGKCTVFSCKLESEFGRKASASESVLVITFVDTTKVPSQPVAGTLITLRNMERKRGGK
jgi:hypothetical protein